MNLKNFCASILATFISMPLVAIVSNEKYAKPKIYTTAMGKAYVEMQVPTTDLERAQNPTKFLKMVTHEVMHLDTRNNKVGVGQDDKCAVIIGSNEIVCTNGTQFKNVRSKKVKIQGSHDYLSDKNYIGSYLILTSGIPGEGELAVYFKQ